MTVSRVSSSSRYASVIGFSSAVRAGEWVTVAGTTAIDSDGQVVGAGDPYVQAQEVLRKIGVALQEAGTDLAHVVQTRIYLPHIEHWEQVGRAHVNVFAAHPPAATMVAVAGLLDHRMLVEIEAVAYVGS